MHFLVLLLVGPLAAVLVIATSPLWLSVRAVGWLVRCVQRRWGKRRPSLTSELSRAEIESDAPLMMVLHGTFAPHAPWTLPTAPMAAAVRQGFQAAGEPCLWHCFVWSGKNTVQARLEGIERLQAQLERVFARNPRRRVVLLAHSHGGNIALKVAQQFMACPGLRLITLATPFLVVQPRANTMLLRMALPMVNVVVMGLLSGAVAYAVAGPAGENVAWGIGVLVALAGALLLPASMRRNEADAQALFATAPDIQTLEPLRSRSLIVSRAGDEADGGLKLASLANSWVTQAINHSQFMTDVTAGMQSLRPFIDPANRTAAALGRVGATLLWKAMRKNFLSNWVLRLLDMLSIWFGFLLLELLQGAVGTKTAVTSACVIVSSSETPPGLWRHLQSLPSALESADLLSHSQIYGDPQVIARVVQWACDESAQPPIEQEASLAVLGG